LLQAGSKIDKYEIIAPLAAGGMAVVYRAKHQYLGREVALKILSSHLSLDDKVRERFAQEAYVQGQLEHANIMPVLDFVAEGPILGIVMPLIEGPSLAQILTEERSGPMSAEDMVALLGPVMSALTYAHRRDLIHRDLKPANVLYERKPGCEWPGRALVADFGLAKVLNTSLGPMLTRAGTTMGTPPYMSPEQYGAAPDIGLQADVHALGMMAWQMLSGALPFVVGDRLMEAQYYTGQRPLQDPPSFGKGVKGSLVSEVKRACAIEVSERTEDAGAFADAVQRAAGGKRLRAKVAAVQAEAAGETAVTSASSGSAGPGARRTVVFLVAVAVSLLVVCLWLATMVLDQPPTVDLATAQVPTAAPQVEKPPPAPGSLEAYKAALERVERWMPHCTKAYSDLEKAGSMEEKAAIWMAFEKANPEASCLADGWKAIGPHVRSHQTSNLRLCETAVLGKGVVCPESRTTLPAGRRLAFTFDMVNTRAATEELVMTAVFFDREKGTHYKNSQRKGYTYNDPSNPNDPSRSWRHFLPTFRKGLFTGFLYVEDKKSGLKRVMDYDFTVE